MNKRSKVTKRQKVLLTSEMHFFSPASYDSILAEMGVVLIEPASLPVSRESVLLLHRLSIIGHALCTGLFRQVILAVTGVRSLVVCRHWIRPLS